MRGGVCRGWPVFSVLRSSTAYRGRRNAAAEPSSQVGASWTTGRAHPAAQARRASAVHQATPAGIAASLKS